MFKKLMIGLLSGCILTACQTTSLNTTPSIQADIQAQNYVKGPQDQFLCAVEHREKQSIVRAMDLKTRQLRNTFVPGKVQGLAGDPETKTLYIHSKEGTYHSLYAVDVKTNAIKRVTLFNQIGLIPEDFVISKGTLYVVGHQKRGTALMSMNLKTKQWKPVVYNVKAGDLEQGLSSKDLQILNFSNEALTKTTVNLTAGHKREVNFDFSQQDRSEEKLNGAISRNGRFIFANFQNKIGRYRIQSNRLVRLNPIPLPNAEARYVALSPSSNTLYVTTAQSNRVLQVRMSQTGENFQLLPLSFPGSNHELVVF